jgi:hypothetical protein
MTNQMVSRFRVKKLSPKHPLPIYKEYQLPDLTDAANIQRAVPQIETGVEKEEEEEVCLYFHIYLLYYCYYCYCYGGLGVLCVCVCV